MIRLLAGLVLACCVLLAAEPARAQAPGPAPDAFAVIHQFYAGRSYKPVWTDGARFSARGKELPAIIEGSAAHGLEPQNYNAARMRELLDATPEDPAGWQRTELLWTYGLWEYAGALAGRPIDAHELESVLSGDIADNLESLAPDQPLYRALKNRLARLTADLNEGIKPVRLSFGRSFKPGMSSPMVPDLRARMAVYGGGSANPAQPDLYDQTLARAVERFQHEYGLKADGVIGSGTLAILNRSPQDERMQVIANLQRLREPHRRVREDRRIEVSIARYWLIAYDRGREALSMPVVVGQPRRQTISFRTEISGVRLNPDWNVPATIKREDMIPMLVQDPARLLREKGVRVVQAGKHIDPTKVDWSKASGQELAQLKFWAPSGDGNPLGRYRVIMENPYDIYLHDTNHPDLFETAMRAQSSGCVRVAKPEELTNFILKGQSGWTPQKIKDVVKKGQTVDVVIENKLPIYLDYMTAWINDRGELILGVDVYALDKPRYENLVKLGLTTQRNAQKILERVTDILQPELQEAQHREPVLTQSAN